MGGATCAPVKVFLWVPYGGMRPWVPGQRGRWRLAPRDGPKAGEPRRQRRTATGPGVARDRGRCGLQPLAQPDLLHLEMLGALFVVSRLIAQLQRFAGVGFRGPIKPPR